MRSNPIRVPISSIMNIAAITITRPAIPVVILPLASATFALSPPEVIIAIAPEMSTKVNQIAATIVNIPIVFERKVLKRVGASLAALPSRPSGPIPSKKPGIICSLIAIKLCIIS